jgi:hypothetical protein
LWALNPNGHPNPYEALENERLGLKEASDVTKYITDNVPSNFFFTVAQTRCCSEQKMFTRPDDCAALQKFLCNMHTKKTPAAREHLSYCAAAHPRSLEGILTPVTVYVA